MRQAGLLRRAAEGDRLSPAEIFTLGAHSSLDELMQAASARRDRTHGQLISYSKKVFIPLTQLCRDVCHYCTFAHRPRKDERAYLSLEEVLAIAEAGAAFGCKEALFTLGDKPELRYAQARRELAALGHETTISYLAEAAKAVLERTGLLPHVNPGVMSAAEIALLRKVSVSQGMMLENAAPRLGERGGPHFGSPDKKPAARLATIRAAGLQSVPFTTGILIGIGETRPERIDALLKLRDMQDEFGHIQEIIIQNFRPKPGTLMAPTPPASAEDHLRTIALARLIFAPEMNIQAPPNLSPDQPDRLVHAGINDWGGVSPLTPDHVNPEAPWPHLDTLAHRTRKAGKVLVERLAIYPAYARAMSFWVDKELHQPLLRKLDGEGLPRIDDWCPGALVDLPEQDVALVTRPNLLRNGNLSRVLAKAQRGAAADEEEIVTLLRARDTEFSAVCRAADELRDEVNGSFVSYVITRNINYTNICSYHCRFCAFSKGKTTDALRGRPYNLSLAEIAMRVREAAARGATEVCMQGGIHPDFSGAHYIEICRAAKAAVPGMHVHAFSPLEIQQGAHTLRLPLQEFLSALKEAGLGTVPGTAAEILDDEVRATLCPDKLSTAEWLNVMRTAHGVGLRSTATIMFGHMERYEHWARHLMRVRELQMETGGFTEFVPLPFVPMEAPIYLKGEARRGPTFREAILMHAVGRLALHPHVTNIQASWVKMGRAGVQVCLQAGVNDLGGTLMDESISRSAGASHGQEMNPAEMEATIIAAGRIPRQRTTTYNDIARRSRSPCRRRECASRRTFADARHG
ncbi:MAG TPA: 5-amino-6-(D-ribitylamino)uracil--L-tyrosine 4-hydroxyphenyl transferase CofH [Beijerinckiaceae bacterium]|nr:5-amino-6-(D-ribitylamino)uracil--L-tyrosine 4-hydroxyphenyl transferase CofH [Beijerinckiaceae bacterium]